MKSIYESLGIDKLMDDNSRLSNLKRYITDNTRYITVGYEYDYYLHTFELGLEFTVCKRTDGTEVGTDVHVCGANFMDLFFDEVWKCQYMCSQNLPKISETIIFHSTGVTTNLSDSEICQGRPCALY